MKTIKIVSAVLLLAAITLPATAADLPASKYWGIESEDREQGNVYNTLNADVGTYYRTQVNGSVHWLLDGDVNNVGDPAKELIPINTAGQTYGDEDDWGLFWLNKIETPKNSGNNWYQAPDNAGGTAIIGIFYGLTDDVITVEADKTYTLSGGNLEFKLWQVNIPSTIQNLYASLFTAPDGLGDTTDRTAADAYDGWTNLPGAQLVLSGGLLTPGDAFIFTSKFTSGGFGSADVWVSVSNTNDAEEGAWNDSWNTSRIDSSLFPPGPPSPQVPQTTSNPDWSDIYMNWTVAGQYDPDQTNTLVSSDFGNAAPIPEPLTALALFGSVASLGAYFRKRRA